MALAHRVGLASNFDPTLHFMESYTVFDAESNGIIAKKLDESMRNDFHLSVLEVYQMYGTVPNLKS